MLIFIKVLLIVYVVAINVYSFILIKAQKKAKEEGCCPVGDGKIFVAAALGGATAVYTAMFIFKYRLTSLFLMVFVPVLIAANVYLIILCFTSNFGLAIQVAAFASKGTARLLLLA